MTAKTVIIKQGERFMQGVISTYDLVEDDLPKSDKRTGGVGSTNE